MIRWAVLLIVKGSRRHGRCGYCQREITWATLAARGGRNVPLVYAPMILREQTGDTGVVAEVLGFDQIHRCPERKTVARPTSPAPPAPAVRRGDGVFASFTTDRLQQLRDAVAHPTPKPSPAPQGELF